MGILADHEDARTYRNANVLTFVGTPWGALEFSVAKIQPRGVEPPAPCPLLVLSVRKARGQERRTGSGGWSSAGPLPWGDGREHGRGRNCSVIWQQCAALAPSRRGVHGRQATRIGAAPRLGGEGPTAAGRRTVRRLRLPLPRDHRHRRLQTRRAPGPGPPRAGPGGAVRRCRVPRKRRGALDAALDAALALRTLIGARNEVWLRAGAGVTGHSGPERETEETCEKLRSVAPFLSFAES